MMKSVFIELIAQYDEALSAKLWQEIEKKHSAKSRHYHSLVHLNDLHKQLKFVQHKIDNWNVVLFTLFYHDIVYNALKSNNEEKSAKIAVQRLAKMGVSSEEVELCKNQILATKSHLKSANMDTNYFTDADLSILGRQEDVYRRYCRNVRKEYFIYPTLLYNRGRKKVVQHFLAMDKIFKTKEFYDKYEGRARENLKSELGVL